MKRVLLLAGLAALAALPARADEVTQALETALEAYADGDVAYAFEELDYARQLLLSMKTEALVAYLPEPPEGWTREIDTEMGAGLAMMGGGTGAEAEYRAPGGDGFTITLMADNPMVGAMAGMLGNAAAMGLKVERIGRQKFVMQEGEITGLVENRILVQASGQDMEAMFATLERIDYGALGRFGQ
jgi:hypothetical protein